jgi:D-tyrosyl-tRNA(Tyr) deacylase
MIALVQRVIRATVTASDPDREAAIGPGLLVLLCAMQGDEDRDVVWMANKLAGLRIFRDEDDRMNRSVSDTGGEVLVVSQFTLAGDCHNGFRPSFIRAASPQDGSRLVDATVEALRLTQGLRSVATGWFGAAMEVSLINDGPVTIWVDSRGNVPKG